jgi:capsular polysaccharide biosynthesis protein
MMDMLGSLLKSSAPTLATAVMGPMGGIAVKAIAEKLGVEDTVEAVTNHLQAHPEDAAKLAEIDLKKMETQAAEMANARAMQLAAMQSEDPFVRRYVYYFITAWSAFSMIFIPAIVFTDIPSGNERFADTILGFLLGTMVASMFSFLLGSSLGSKQKDKK